MDEQTNLQTCLRVLFAHRSQLYVVQQVRNGLIWGGWGSGGRADQLLTGRLEVLEVSLGTTVALDGSIGVCV